jgi:Tfp pilus assembly protein PilW
VSLVELLIATAITVTTGGALLSLVVAGQSIARLQPEAADLQQRARIATQVIATELSRAGAGIDSGPLAGPLGLHFPAVAASPDGGLTIWYVSERGAQGTLTAALPADGISAAVALDAACAAASCGFSENTTAVILDNSGCHDLARIEDATPAAVVLSGPSRSCGYSAGAAIAQGEVRTFRVDPASRQLLRRDEATGISLPISDNVAAMSVDYLDAGRRIRVTLRLVPALLRQVPDLAVTLDVRPPNLQGQ